MEISFSALAWEQYLEWQVCDKKILKRINDVLKGIVRGSPYEGIGKPEALKGNLSGLWSRRIDGQHRLVYRIVEGISGAICQIIQCKGHYDD